MGIAVIPAPSAASKTLKKVTLTSGTSYTVPAGVTEMNVLLVGGGGGACRVGTISQNGGMGAGIAGQTIWSTISTTPGASISYSIGAGGAGGTTAQPQNGSGGGNTTMTGATTATGGGGGVLNGQTSTANISFANNGGITGVQDSTTNVMAGGSGGSGWIYVEYWS